MAWKGNQKRVAAGKKGGRPKKKLIVATEAVTIDDDVGDEEMADVEQPAAVEKAAAEKEAAEEQPACGLLALPWEWWEVAVVLQRRPLLQARFLGLVGMTCKLLHEELDTVYLSPGTTVRQQSPTALRQHSDSTPTAPTAPTIDSSDSSDRVRQHYDSKNARDHVYTLS